MILLLAAILFYLSIYVYIRPQSVALWFGAMVVSCFPGPIFLLESTLILLLLAGDTLKPVDWISLFLLISSWLASGFLLVHFIFKPLQIQISNSSAVFKKNIVKLFTIHKYSHKSAKTYSLNSRNSEPLSFDYYPSAAANNKCVIQIFGGGYTAGSRRQLPNVNNFFVECGYSVFALDYRYLPSARWPTPLHDVEDSIEFILQHPDFAKKYETFIFAGRSSGSQLCTLTGLTRFKKNVSGFILFYPPTDLIEIAKAKHGKILESKKADLKKIGEKYLQEKPEEFALKELSPIEYVDAQHPPTLLLHGTYDPVVPVSQSQKYLNKLRALNIQSDLVLCPFESHGFEVNLNSPGGQIASFAMKEFLKQF